MLKRTLFFINPHQLNIRNRQLIITDKEKGITRQCPIEDLGFVVIDNSQITITTAVAQELAENNVALVFCNEKHLPVSMMLNLDAHYIHQEIFRNQLQAAEPLKKNLWKQTIEAKIRNQAALLKKIGKPNQELLHYTRQIKSGDSDNQEAKAARIYWSRLFDFDGFKRHRFGAYPNPALNYGYAVLRAGVARALVGSGLLPTIGIHHHNRYNAYCLADDIMEPYRPFVDLVVLDVIKRFPEPFKIKIENEEDNQKLLTTEIRTELLKVLTVDTHFDDKTRPLMVALSITSASVAKCFSGEKRKIRFPSLS